ncbi:hypothetical protein MTR_6g089800 [Medicago truncatula]|uniref:Uncharacterized protein n=1 Tax=Medicago truncatula TaxID=3880 RepID=G7KI19_MEDTR|nr:hypothetical protein MTR_6g089800 [Medicago truncatula]
MADAKLCWPSENPPYKHSVAAYGGNMTGTLGFADYGPHSIKSRCCCGGNLTTLMDNEV